MTFIYFISLFYLTRFILIDLTYRCLSDFYTYLFSLFFYEHGLLNDPLE